MKLNAFLSQNTYIISAALFVIGLILKQTPKIKNWWIPYILSIIGIISCMIILGPSTNSFFQGLVSAGVSVYMHQLGKQGIEAYQSKN